MSVSVRHPLIGARPGSLLRRVYGRPGACLLRSLLPQLIELRPCRGVVIVETLAHSRVHVFVSLGPRFPASLLCGPAWAGLRLLRKCFYPVVALQCSVLLLQSAVVQRVCWWLLSAVQCSVVLLCSVVYLARTMRNAIPFPFWLPLTCGGSARLHERLARTLERF